MHHAKSISNTYSRIYPITVLQHALTFALWLDLAIFDTAGGCLPSVSLSGHSVGSFSLVLSSHNGLYGTQRLSRGKLTKLRSHVTKSGDRSCAVM